MNKETRIRKIEEIIQLTEKSDKPERIGVYWKDANRSMLVCQIPLECLIYNKYNGRILSRTKSLESQGHIIDAETKEGERKIDELLWQSKKNRNEITKIDIEKKGQLKVGIITKDGIIIDGNRRVMLLNRIKKYNYFIAVVLPVELKDDPIEIEKLETTYQMGEDEKLGYNPIEKYLKAKQLYKKLNEQFNHKESIDKIADWMGEKPSEIEHYLGVVDVMDRYLEYLKYDGIYSMADTHDDGKEDLFLHLKKWIDTFKDKDVDGKDINKESDKGFDHYSLSDVDDLETICFDYIRAKIGKSYDGKRFRSIADGRRKNHFFGNKKIWDSFQDYHMQYIFPFLEKIDNTIPIDYDSENLEAHLSGRDSKYRDAVLDDLTKNIGTHNTELGYNKASDKPMELVSNARKALETTNQKHESFSAPNVLNQVEAINQITTDMLNDKSSKRLLSQIIHLLESVKLDLSESTEELLEKVVQINKISFEMKKKLGG